MVGIKGTMGRKPEKTSKTIAGWSCLPNKRMNLTGIPLRSIPAGYPYRYKLRKRK